MNHQKNQKYQRTHLLIQEALYLLSKEQEHVTVSDICKYCNINRTTFYLHYEDINALIKAIHQNMSIEILKDFSSLDDSYRIPFSKKSYIIFANHVKKNIDYYRIFFKANITFPISLGFDNAWKNIIVPLYKKNNIFDEEIMLIRFIGFQAGFTNILRKWVEGDCKQSCDEIGNIIYECVKL